MNNVTLTMLELDRAVRRAPRFEHAHLHDVGGRYMARLVSMIEPKLIVELGTGDGATAAQVAAALPAKAKFITVNWPNPPSGDAVGSILRRFLDEAFGSMRVFQQHMTRDMFLLNYSADEQNMRKIVQLYGDTCEERVLAEVEDGATELLYIDSTHTYECASREWRLWSPKLADRAIVVVDDLSHNDMRDFWGPLPYDKVEFCEHGWDAGMFRYRR